MRPGHTGSCHHRDQRLQLGAVGHSNPPITPNHGLSPAITGADQGRPRIHHELLEQTRYGRCHAGQSVNAVLGWSGRHQRVASTETSDGRTATCTTRPPPTPPPAPKPKTTASPKNTPPPRLGGLHPPRHRGRRHRPRPPAPETPGPAAFATATVQTAAIIRDAATHQYIHDRAEQLRTEIRLVVAVVAGPVLERAQVFHHAVRADQHHVYGCIPRFRWPGHRLSWRRPCLRRRPGWCGLPAAGGVAGRTRARRHRS